MQKGEGCADTAISLMQALLMKGAMLLHSHLASRQNVCCCGTGMVEKVSGVEVLRHLCDVNQVVGNALPLIKWQLRWKSSVDDGQIASVSFMCVIARPRKYQYVTWYHASYMICGM